MLVIIYRRFTGSNVWKLYFSYILLEFLKVIDVIASNRAISAPRELEIR